MTVDSKNFIAIDACGTDGSDDSKLKAIYDFIDGGGYTHSGVRIAYSVHLAGNDNDINAALIAAASEI